MLNYDPIMLVGPVKHFAKVRLSTLLIGSCFSTRPDALNSDKKRKKATSWYRHSVAVDNCHISEVPELCRAWQVSVRMTVWYFHFLTQKNLPLRAVLIVCKFPFFVVVVWAKIKGCRLRFECICFVCSFRKVACWSLPRCKISGISGVARRMPRGL